MRSIFSLPTERLEARLPRTWARTKSAGYAFTLLLERRLWLFAAVNALMVLSGVFDAAQGGGRLNDIYPKAVLWPSLILGVPALSGIIALERRAGSLDLALASPSTERYFLRRALPVCAVLTVQAWAILTLTYLENSGGPVAGLLALPSAGGAYFRALYQALETSLLIAAVVLFWAVRLRTSGAVWMASLATLGVLQPWLATDPAFSRGQAERFLGFPVAPLLWTWHAVVLGLAIAVFYLYARYRLRRPETLLA